MNVNPETYKNLALIGDKSGHLPNILVSDFNQTGVAYAHEISSPAPARCFLSSAALERSGCLATFASEASSVRKHGGGQARSPELAPKLAGRFRRSGYGEINSLYAAAGIIALASRPSGAHGSPLTVVRRAARLRSSPRPHAQPAEGYPSIQKPFLLELRSLSAFSQRASQLSQAQVLGLTDNSGVLKRTNVSLEPGSVVSYRTGSPQRLDIRPSLLCYSDATEHRVDQPVRYRFIEHRPHCFTGTQHTLGGNPLRSEQLSVSSFLKGKNGLHTCAFTYPCHSGLLRIRICFCRFSGLLMAALRDPNSDKNCTNRAYCLHPRCSRCAVLHCQHEHPHRGKQYNGTRHACVGRQPHQSLLNTHTATPLIRRWKLKAKSGYAVDPLQQEAAA